MSSAAVVGSQRERGDVRIAAGVGPQGFARGEEVLVRFAVIDPAGRIVARQQQRVPARGTLGMELMTVTSRTSLATGTYLVSTEVEQGARRGTAVAGVSVQGPNPGNVVCHGVEWSIGAGQAARVTPFRVHSAGTPLTLTGLVGYPASRLLPNLTVRSRNTTAGTERVSAVVVSSADAGLASARLDAASLLGEAGHYQLRLLVDGSVDTGCHAEMVIRQD